METKTKRAILIAVVTLTVALVILLVSMGLMKNRKQPNTSGWVLRVADGNVALYNNGTVEKVYDEIVLDNLPPDDISMLESGISFSTKEEAERAIEDYDG